jgi:phenylalanyl-tRNA synthetase beta chain
VTVPPERGDLRIPEDLSDEIIRLKGLETIPHKLPVHSTGASASKTFILGEKIKDILIAAGFSEIITRTLSDDGYFEVAHALSDKSFLKTDLSCSMSSALEKAVLNADLLGIDDVRIFEIGEVFPKTGERTSLIVAGALVRKRKGKSHADIVNDGVIAIKNELKIEVDSQVALLPGNVGAYTEIDLTQVAKDIGELSYEFRANRASENKFVPFSIYPHITRDIAVFVPDGVKDSDVWSVVEPLAGPLLVKHRLFDVFQKANPDGSKRTSYAFRLVFQSMERTLRDSDVDGSIADITVALNDKDGWEVR